MANVRSITPNDPADFTPVAGNYKELQPFRYWCHKVLPLVYDDSLSYYELLCKVVDYLNKTMEDVDTLHGDVVNLHTAYEELQSYVNNYFSTLDVQEEINKKLDTMASDGTLENIINNQIFGKINDDIKNLDKYLVFTENDFINHDKIFILNNDITVTKPIVIDSNTNTIDLNGHTITVDNNYTHEYIFRITNLITNNVENLDTLQTSIGNGRIDCNNKHCSVFLINNIGNTKISNLVIYNNINGLFSYNVDRKNTMVAGGQVQLKDIVITHSRESYDSNIGLDIQFGDSSITNVYPQFFKYGVRLLHGSNNVLTNVHPWGLPKVEANTYSTSTQMKIGFAIFSNSNRLISCISDTFEPIDETVSASYENGGIGFYINTEDIKLIGCIGTVHPQSNNNNHIYYYFDDTSPFTKLTGYLNENVMCSCSVSLMNGSVVKGQGLTITNSREKTLDIINCILSDRRLISNINQPTQKLDSYTQLNNNELNYSVNNDRVLVHYKLNDKDTLSTIEPFVDASFNSYTNFVNSVTKELKGKAYGMRLFKVNNDLYVYEPLNNLVCKLGSYTWSNL